MVRYLPVSDWEMLTSIRLLLEVVGVARGLHTTARVGLYNATPPDTAGRAEPFWTTMTLGFPGLTVLMTPGSLWPVIILCWVPTPGTELGTT